jgi:hypothetical protein
MVRAWMTNVHTQSNAKQDITSGLRSAGTVLWCFGFFLAAFERIYVELLSWNIPFCFVFFFLATLFCFWAEKREFSLRYALYRVHDLAMYSPWRFLLLYFLWINLFAPFTSQPLRSVVYALGGWSCLVMVGFSAQFLFCQRSVSRTTVLLRDRLQLVYWAFCAVALVGTITLLVGQLDLIADTVNFLFFLLLGLPFLLWDLLLRKQSILPKKVSITASIFIAVAIAQTQRNLFLFGFLLILVGLLALRFYKGMRLRETFFIAAILIVAASSLAHVADLYPIFVSSRNALELRLSVSVLDALNIARSNNYLGTGIAISSNRNGIWAQILAELGIVGVLLYLGFLLNLLRDLYTIGRAPPIVVSNIAFISLAIFCVLVSHYYNNAYSPAIWSWYAVWALLASSRAKRVARL